MIRFLFPALHANTEHNTAAPGCMESTSHNLSSDVLPSIPTSSQPSIGRWTPLGLGQPKTATLRGATRRGAAPATPRPPTRCRLGPRQATRLWAGCPGLVPHPRRVPARHSLRLVRAPSAPAQPATCRLATGYTTTQEARPGAFAAVAATGRAPFCHANAPRSHGSVSPAVGYRQRPNHRSHGQ